MNSRYRDNFIFEPPYYKDDPLMSKHWGVSLSDVRNAVENSYHCSKFVLYKCEVNDIFFILYENKDIHPRGRYILTWVSAEYTRSGRIRLESIPGYVYEDAKAFESDHSQTYRGRKKNPGAWDKVCQGLLEHLEENKRYNT